MNKKKQEKKERNKLDKEWKQQIKLRDVGCVICGVSERANCHHIISRNIKELRHDVMNGILLCPSHHKWGTFSAHKNGLWFTNWLIEHRNEQYVYLSKFIQKFK